MRDVTKVTVARALAPFVESPKVQLVCAWTLVMDCLSLRTARLPVFDAVVTVPRRQRQQHDVAGGVEEHGRGADQATHERGWSRTSRGCSLKLLFGIEPSLEV